MTPDEKKRFDALPASMRQRLSKKKKTNTEHKKLLCVLKYSSFVKLKAVIRWKERMARQGIATQSLAESIGVPPTRISEYLNFTKEPIEDIFQSIEEKLYNLGA